LRSIKTGEGGAAWLDYCRKNKISLATNVLFPPTLILEYTGAIPSRKLPQLSQISEGDDLADWFNKSKLKCEHYYTRRLPRLVDDAMKNLRRKISECNRSEVSRRTFRAAYARWKKNRKVLREFLLIYLTFNAITSFIHKRQERVDIYLQHLIWILDLWETGMPIPVLKLIQLINERLQLLAKKQGKDTSGPGWPNTAKLGKIKTLDLGDSEFISYAVLGFPITKGSLIPVEIFTSDPKDKTIERAKMCKELLRGLLELLSEQGFGDRLKVVPRPGVIHFLDKKIFLNPIKVATL